MEDEHKIMIARVAVSGLLLCTTFFAALPEVVAVAIGVVAYLVVGADIILKAVRNAIHGDVFDENFLMAIATIGAFAIGEYPEAVAVMMFYQVGELFSDIAVERSKASISSLMDIRPDYANIMRDGDLVRVAPADVPQGSVIVVKPGEKIPLDGTVVEGRSVLDTSALTGESLPRDVQTGSEVLSGCLNLTGVISIRTSGTYGSSTVAKILDLVENAEVGKAQSEKFITRFARYYTPIVVAVAVLLAVMPPLVVGGDWRVWFDRALVFLVVSCPCALVISIPLTFFAGIGGASRRGILVKGSSYLELLAQLRTVVFDKTGTITQGNFTVTYVDALNGDTRELLELSALAECYSEHPVSASLREAYGAQIDKSRVTEVQDFAGEGISAAVDGRRVYVGNEKLMKRAGVDFHPCTKIGTVVYVAAETAYMGCIVVSDSLKPQSQAAIAELKSLGVARVVMLTGDRANVAGEVAREAGVDEYHADLLPADKVRYVDDYRRGNSRSAVAFVGDGVNDAPVLKMADVGIAMGAAGSDAAIEAADVVLMNDNPKSIADGVKIARITRRIVMQNISFAIGVKVIVLMLGAAGWVSMWAAVFADVGVTMLAVLNALRALRPRI